MPRHFLSGGGGHRTPYFCHHFAKFSHQFLAIITESCTIFNFSRRSASDPFEELTSLLKTPELIVVATRRRGTVKATRRLAGSTVHPPPPPHHTHTHTVRTRLTAVTGAAPLDFLIRTYQPVFVFSCIQRQMISVAEL